MASNAKSSIKVYYNSACPVCNAGINAQKNKMTNCGIEWNDVHIQSGVYKEVSPDLEFVRKKLHVIDEEGKIKIGIEAFVAIWKHSPGEHWKATLVSLPIVKQILTFTYNLFAWLLYQWNRHKRRW